MRTVMHPGAKLSDKNIKAMVYGGSHSLVNLRLTEKINHHSLIYRCLVIYFSKAKIKYFTRNMRAVGNYGLADTREPVSCLHPHQRPNTIKIVIAKTILY